MKTLWLVTALIFMNSIVFAKDVLGKKPYQAVVSESVSSQFVDVSKVNSNIRVEMRYFSDWNFLGRRVVGYDANKCLLTKSAATALSQVQDYVQGKGYALLVFDCYRPQRAVTDFLKWTQDGNDQPMRKLFYPDQPKETLVAHGYIADKSSHSRGSTVDLTLIKLEQKQPATSMARAQLRYQEEATDCRQQKNIESTGQLDMGTSFDCFDIVANTKYSRISAQAAKNRLILKNSMEKFGFSNYTKEWWHYTLKNEPYKDKFFDFAVQ